MVLGRRPAGLSVPTSEKEAGVLGGYLANAAQLEAAAVIAFAIITDELRAYGAPVKLIAEAERAQEDEVRHTTIMTALAASYSTTPGEWKRSPTGNRALADIAAENEVEGCVRETFAALIAHWQALHAEDHSIATAMAGIAEEETRHAALSWKVANWAVPLLNPSERSQLNFLRRNAIEALRAELAAPLPDDLIHKAGLPTPTQAHALLDQMDRELWSVPDPSVLDDPVEPLGIERRRS